MIDLKERVMGLGLRGPSGVSGLRHGYPLAEGGKGSFLKNPSYSYGSLGERRTLEEGRLLIFLDERGRFWEALGVRKLLNPSLLRRGRFAVRMERPLSNDTLLFNGLGELQALTVPSSAELLGKLAPDPAGRSLIGEAVALAELP